MDAEFAAETLTEIAEDVIAVDVQYEPANEDERELARILRYRARFVDELARVKRETAAMVTRLENRLAAVDYVLTPKAAVLVERLLAGQKRVRSVVTPYGKAGWRKQPGGLVVENEAALIQAWREGHLPTGVVRNGDPVVVKKELNRLFCETGELFPGCEENGPTDKFYMGE